MVLPGQNNRKQVGIEVSMAVTSQIIFFCGVTPYRLVDDHNVSGNICRPANLSS